MSEELDADSEMEMESGSVVSPFAHSPAASITGAEHEVMEAGWEDALTDSAAAAFQHGNVGNDNAAGNAQSEFEQLQQQAAAVREMAESGGMDLRDADDLELSHCQSSSEAHEHSHSHV